MLLPSTSGCGNSPAAYVITGRVTYLGQPVTSGLINFRGPDGKLYGGGLQSDGQYEFRLPAGEFAIRIDSPAPLSPGWKEGHPLPTNLRPLLPARYANFRSSHLKLIVTAEPESQIGNFALE